MTSLSARQLATALVMAGILTSGAAGASPARPGPKPTIESVIQAWEQRQKRVQSFRFAWEGTEWLDRESAGARASAESAEDVLPASDVSFKTRQTLAMDAQGRMRQERFRMAWNAPRGKLLPATHIEVWDGRIHRNFSPEGPVNRFKGSGPIPCGQVSDKVPDGIGKSVALLPLRLVFRSFDSSIGVFDRKNLRLADPPRIGKPFPYLVIRHERETVLVKPRRPGADQVSTRREETIWVDPQRAFVPVRRMDTTGDVSTLQVEIEYSEDKEFGWIPASWNIVWMSPNGKVMGNFSGKLTEYQINRPLPESTFQLTFPTGTWVNDSVTKESYILREGGKRRPVLPGEWNGRNYEQLLRSEPPAPR